MKILGQKLVQYTKYTFPDNSCKCSDGENFFLIRQLKKQPNVFKTIEVICKCYKLTDQRYLL
jgi:hypothetical protein